MGKVILQKNISLVVNKAKSRGQKVGFLTGAFDLIHVEHVDFLREAKNRVDVLVVGLHNDETVRKTKGNLRPIFNQNDRAKMIAAFECVDFVFVCEETIDMSGSKTQTYYDNLKLIVKPDYVFYNSVATGTKNTASDAEREKKFGLKIVNLNLGVIVHSTDIIKRIREYREE